MEVLVGVPVGGGVLVDVGSGSSVLVGVGVGGYWAVEAALALT